VVPYFTPQRGDIPAKRWRIHPRAKPVAFCCRGKRRKHKRFYPTLYALCAMLFAKTMKEGKDDELEEAKELFKEGLKKIFQATKKASEKLVEGFREGYAKDVTKKEK
jgi:hypothetical protein